MAYGFYVPNSGPLTFPTQGPLTFPNSGPLTLPQPTTPGQLIVPQTIGPGVPRTNFQLGPTGPLQTPSVPNFRLGETGPLVTPRGATGAGPSGIFNVPTGLKPVLEQAPPTRFAIPGEVPARFEIPGAQSVPYADIRANSLGPRPTYNNVTLPDYAPGTVNPNVASIPQGVAAPSEMELAGLRSGQGALPTWLGNTGAVDVSAGSNFLNSGVLGSDVGGLASKSFGKWGNIGAAIGIPLAGQAVASHLSDPAQAGAVRGISNVAGQGSWALPMMAGQLGISGVGTLPAIGAAAAGAGLAQGFSATDVGNKTINQMRGQDTGNGPGDYAAAAAQGLFGALPLVGRAAEKLGFLSGSTNDTVGDVLGGGSDTAAKSQAAPVVTPEQRMAQTSPDSLAKIATDYGLSDAMKQKLLKNYNQAMVMAKTQGAVSLPVDKDGKIDGMDAKDYPGAKQITDAKGNTQWVSTNPADIQQSVFEQATQLIPSLGHAQEQEDDFFRKQAVMQSQLEAAMPTLYDAPSWQGDPYAKQLAMTEARAIPSRYVQAQALQAQQGYDNQIAQAMQQQQLAAQYPDLFGKKSSSSTPTTIDAAMAQ